MISANIGDKDSRAGHLFSVHAEIRKLSKQKDEQQNLNFEQYL